MRFKHPSFLNSNNFKYFVAFFFLYIYISNFSLADLSHSHHAHEDCNKECSVHIYEKSCSNSGNIDIQNLEAATFEYGETSEFSIKLNKKSTISLSIKKLFKRGPPKIA